VKDGYLVVDTICDREKGRILKLKVEWRCFDFQYLPLVVSHRTDSNVRHGYFQVGNEIMKDMDNMEAYKIGLTTWSNWIDSNIDPSKTTVIFQGIAAYVLSSHNY
jgi:hypothetical protein